jgi:hypothetical protein
MRLPTKAERQKRCTNDGKEAEPCTPLVKNQAAAKNEAMHQPRPRGEERSDAPTEAEESNKN